MPADVIAAARAWVGTPFRHQGRTLGVGVDCAGIPEGVAFALGLPLGPAMPTRNYRRRGNGVALLAECDAHLDRWTGELRPGLVALFWIGQPTIPTHMGVLTDLRGGLGLVHAWSIAAVNRTVETELDEFWRKRIFALFAFRGVDYGGPE